MLRRFRNQSENQIQRQIRAVVGKHGAELHEKVRVADVIEIGALEERYLGTYALQAHFDFVLIDDTQQPIAVIEFDGPGHDPRNDIKKDAICIQADLPLIRIFGFEQVRETNSTTLSRYLVELIFHARIFLLEKQSGRISYDEPFMLSSFLKPDAKHIFDSEFDFVVNANSKITKALKENNLSSDPLPHLSINRLTLQAPDSTIRAFLSIDSIRGPIVGTGRLRLKLASPGFLADLGTVGAEFAEFAYGMAADDLLENIRLLANGFGHVVTRVDDILAELTSLGPLGYKLITGGGGGVSEADLIGAFAKGNGGKLF